MLRDIYHSNPALRAFGIESLLDSIFPITAVNNSLIAHEILSPSLARRTIHVNHLAIWIDLQYCHTARHLSCKITTLPKTISFVFGSVVISIVCGIL